MRSYIKIFGPPLLKAIKTLERVAVNMPEVCIMDTVILEGVSSQIAQDIGVIPQKKASRDPGTSESLGGSFAMNYFVSTGVPITLERCNNILSKSGQALGEYDFFFEWFENPKQTQLSDLIEKIDATLKPLGCLYTITTK